MIGAVGEQFFEIGEPAKQATVTAGTFETLLCVLPVPGGDKEWYLYAARAGLPIGVASHRSFVSLSTIARCEGSDKSARAATIFTDNGAPQALVASQGARKTDRGWSADCGLLAGLPAEQFLAKIGNMFYTCSP